MTNTETSIYYHETNQNMFQIGDLIRCPSSDPNIYWRITRKTTKGVLTAELTNTKSRPTNSNITTMTIDPKAFHGWEKVSL